MKIAQIAPLYESVPPKLYGGTERIASYLTEELVARNHDVTLFASADSVTRARLIPASESALRLSPTPVVDTVAHYIRLLELVFREAHQFDVLHFHIDYLHFPFTKRQPVPAVTTLHGNLSIPDLVPLYKEFREMNVVSISDAQRQPLPWIGWWGTVYHGIPENLYQLHETPGEYLAFLGRICPEKRLDRAIEIAKRSGRKLRIAAKVDPADREYFSDSIKPILNHRLIELMGEIGEDQKDEFLGNARALLFPIDWPEPFGLVLIEAMLKADVPLGRRWEKGAPESYFLTSKRPIAVPLHPSHNLKRMNAVRLRSSRGGQARKNLGELSENFVLFRPRDHYMTEGADDDLGIIPT